MGQRLVVDGVESADVEIASTPASRRTGLLGRTQLDGAMWFPGIRSVHTVRMRFPIDVAHVDRSGTVIATRLMVPNRLGAWRGTAAGVLEAQAGAFARWQLHVGSRIQVGPWPAN